MESKTPIHIFWFRRDLRIEDNAGLYHALKSPYPVMPIFIFDDFILNKLEDKQDARVNFIHQQLITINQSLLKLNSSLSIFKGKVDEIWQLLLEKYNIKAVYANHDYEPYATDRDLRIKNILLKNGIEFHTFKDQVIFEKDEIVSDNGSPYRVYTPYKNKWLKKLNSFYLKPYPCEKYYGNFLTSVPLPFLSLSDIGFGTSQIPIPASAIDETMLAKYNEQRDFPHLQSTSMLGVHLRFGTVSTRQMVSKAKEINATWLSEFIWREFFMQIMYHNPEVKDNEFNIKLRNFPWRYNSSDFEAWCVGNTGYPLVDAGMRQLNQTGYMHNRVRMVVASFLCKHLLIDWRMGEAYFAKKLLDFDLSANNGNWQWSAGTGADAQPFFRIFNPQLQQERFDPHHLYIKKWVPEFGTFKYVAPMIDHKWATQRAKDTFSQFSMSKVN